ncbi:MAG: GNAT family N-acetyltransferase [Egibacteraceae bacterium]
MNVLETERLRLRPLTVGDVDEFVALHADGRVSRFVDSYDQPAALKRLAGVERQWIERGHGLCAVLLKESGSFVGRCGLEYWPQFDETEMAWVLRPQAWGRGYATEAAQACLEWGFARFPLEYVTAMINSENTASIAVAERLGFCVLREDVLGEIPVRVYALQRPVNGLVR